ncbi:MAG: glycosyltransferase family A protein [Burkholderiaceae bacterium]
MSAAPSFSVVVPLYNKAAHIRGTLQSCLAQSLAPLEIVVVDDGSTDHGGAEVLALAAPSVRLVRQANGGVARARNAGIEQARGDWVVFLDADDWQHPQFLQGLAELIEQYPQAEVVASRYRSLPADRLAALQAWPLAGAALPHELVTDLPRRWQQGTSFFTSSVAVRRERLLSLQPCFPPGENYGEDMDLWFRLAELGPIALHRDALIARVWTADGLSVTHAARSEAPFLLRLEARALRRQTPAALIASTLAFVDHQRISLARDAIGAGRRKQAVALLWRARRHWTDKRWLLTAGMGTLLPGPLVQRWQRWRKRRRMVLG